MNGLPSEVHMHIISFCSLRTQLSLEQVSHHYQNLLRRFWASQGKFAYTLSAEKSRKYNLRFVRNFFKKFNCIQLTIKAQNLDELFWINFSEILYRIKADKLQILSIFGDRPKLPKLLKNNLLWQRKLPTNLPSLKLIQFQNKEVTFRKVRNGIEYELYT